MRKLGIVLVISLLGPFGLVGTAAAQDKTFDSVAQGATRIDRDHLAGIIWAMTAPCSSGDDLNQRQCRAVRDARVRANAGQTFIVSGDASAFVVEAFDDKKKSAPLTVQGCIACVDPLIVDGKHYYVLSNMAPPEWKGSIAVAAPIHTTSKTFKSGAEAAVNWRTEVVPRLKTDFVIKIPSSGALWKADGKLGLGVEVLGFRVGDPCDGHIICASPKAGKIATDKSTCGETVAEGEPEEPKVEGPPDELTPKMIKTVMQPTGAAAQACFEKYGVAGDAKLAVTVAGSGEVLAIEQTGDFIDTPTGRCLEDAVKGLTFPKTKKTKQSFKYPYVLR